MTGSVDMKNELRGHLPMPAQFAWSTPATGSVRLQLLDEQGDAARGRGSGTDSGRTHDRGTDRTE